MSVEYPADERPNQCVYVSTTHSIIERALHHDWPYLAKNRETGASADCGDLRSALVWAEQVVHIHELSPAARRLLKFKGA